MNIRTPVTALAIALGLACASTFAAQPLDAGVPSPAVQPASQAPGAGQEGPLVAIVRKVYFFNQLDRNHNGQLTRAEIPKDLVFLRQNFDRIDFNGNGQLSREEILLYERGEAPEYIGVNHAYVYVFNGPHRSVNLTMAQ